MKLDGLELEACHLVWLYNGFGRYTYMGDNEGQRVKGYPAIGVCTEILMGMHWWPFWDRGSETNESSPPNWEGLQAPDVGMKPILILRFMRLGVLPLGLALQPGRFRSVSFKILIISNTTPITEAYTIWVLSTKQQKYMHFSAAGQPPIRRFSR